MTRIRLPNRRPCMTTRIEHDGHKFHVSWGLDQSGLVREIFIAGGKDGQMLRHLVDDAAIIASIALQHGATIAELLDSVGRDPGSAERMASPIGTALAVVVAEAAA